MQKRPNRFCLQRLSPYTKLPRRQWHLVLLLDVVKGEPFKYLATTIEKRVSCFFGEKKNEFTRNFERCHVMYEWARSITMQHSSSSSRIPHKKMPFAFYLDGESHYAADTATAASQLSQSVIAHSPTIIKSSKIDPHMVV